MALIDAVSFPASTVKGAQVKGEITLKNTSTQEAILYCRVKWDSTHNYESINVTPSPVGESLGLHFPHSFAGEGAGQEPAIMPNSNITVTIDAYALNPLDPNPDTAYVHETQTVTITATDPPKTNILVASVAVLAVIAAIGGLAYYFIRKRK